MRPTLPLLVVLLLGCPRQPPRVSGPKLSALRVSQPPVLDGAAEEADWIRAPTTGAFGAVADGAPLSPHTEVRALWNDEALWLAVYCADQDLRSTDLIHVSLKASSEITLTVSPAGTITGAPAGIRAAVELDGTLDRDEGGDDEEWVVELEVPWKAVGLKGPPPSLEVAAWRADQPTGADPRTVSWSNSAGKPSSGLIELTR